MEEKEIERAAKNITAYFMEAIDKVFNEMVSEVLGETDKLYALLSKEASDESEIRAQRVKVKTATDAMKKVAEYKDRVLQTLASN